jgi:hypothetical protein
VPFHYFLIANYVYHIAVIGNIFWKNGIPLCFYVAAYKLRDTRWLEVWSDEVRCITGGLLKSGGNALANSDALARASLGDMIADILPEHTVHTGLPTVTC